MSDRSPPVFVQKPYSPNSNTPKICITEYHEVCIESVQCFFLEMLFFISFFFFLGGGGGGGGFLPKALR